MAPRSRSPPKAQAVATSITQVNVVLAVVREQCPAFGNSQLITESLIDQRSVLPSCWSKWTRKSPGRQHTVVPSNVSYPTDSGLLYKAIRRIAVTGRRVQAAERLLANAEGAPRPLRHGSRPAESRLLLSGWVTEAHEMMLGLIPDALFDIKRRQT